MTTVPQPNQKAGDPMTEAITAYIGNLTAAQQAHVAKIVGHHTPPSAPTCPDWCERKDDPDVECRGGHWATIGDPVNGSRVNDTYFEGQGDPIQLPMILTQISWPVADRSGLTISLFDRASEVAWEFEPDRMIDLMANMALAIRKLAEDGERFWPGWSLGKLVEHVDAIRPKTAEARS